MKLIRYTHDNRYCLGILEGETICEIEDVNFYETEIDESHECGTTVSINDVKVLSPVNPTKVVCIGLNYRKHAAEFDLKVPEEPMVILKPTSAIIADGENIIYPHHMSHRVDFEGELGIVIKQKIKDIEPDEAKDAILGYTIVNDVTARDLQKTDVQFTRAKSFDTFCPIGPVIETNLKDPASTSVKTYLNGELKQDACTSDMIFNVYELVSFVSKIMTLMPGDIISTGTPSGVAKMKDGDKVEVTIEGIGTLTNFMKD